MAWDVVLVDEVVEWFNSLDDETTDLVLAAVDLLKDQGPALGRPLVDRIKGSALHNLKELRPGSVGKTEVRILFIFDPNRQAVFLVAGDKAGQWKSWYVKAVALAEKRYTAHLAETTKRD